MTGTGFADVDAVIARAMGAWRPPPELSLSRWADRHFVLSAETAAEPGRWHTLPYQREIMDAITDQNVRMVVVQKSSRIGYTLMISGAIGYFMEADPSSMMVVQPTVDDAKNFSKETIAPMLRDVPVLSRLAFRDIEEKGKGPKDSSMTLQHKALDINLLVPTPEGWATIADLCVGDTVFDEAGRRTRVSHVTPVFEGRPCYTVTFSDGAEVTCDAEHAWQVERWAGSEVRREILTTREIAARGARMGNRYRFAISNAGPLDLAPLDLPLDPYVLGAWLGDGSRHRANIHSGHHDAAEMQTLLESCGCRVDARNAGGTMLLQLDSGPARRDPRTGRMEQRTTGVMGALRELGVLGKVGDSRKRIPAIYLRAARSQREALLQGLMDTDGSIRAGDGVCVFVTVIQGIASAFGELLSSLGVKWTRHYRYPHGGRPAVAFTFNPPPSVRVFRLQRKAARQLTRHSLKSGRRRIVAVDPVASVPVKCITVEADSHLFLVGARMIPTHNSFPGGILSLIGANSGAGFRRVSRRVVIFDEVDAYPPSAGSEGDQIHLGMKRSEAFHNRKTIAGSTPLIAGASRIEELFLAGDQRRYHVPCPHCGFKDFLVFERKAERGHVMRWPDGGDPLDAYFECRGNGCKIEHKDKRWMVERGEWIPDNPGAPHRSYHLWSALSYSPNATWGQIATEFLEAKRGGPEKLRTFVNTTLGETWKERGEAPDWERLYLRREKYPIGSVPEGPIVLTAGVDVQKDRFVYEVVGWAANKESWSIDAGELYGDTALESSWELLDGLISRPFVGFDGALHTISMLAVDSGYNTQMVYGWARRYPMSRVIATKGTSRQMLVSTPSPVEITVRGKRLQRGYKVWPVGVDVAKAELYGWLRLRTDGAGAPPPGYCHFPEHGEGYFQQLTAEHLVTTANKRTRRTRMEWQVLANRENHILDARVYARAAAAVLGIDRIAPSDRDRVQRTPAKAAKARTPAAAEPGKVGLPQLLEPKPIAASSPKADQPREGFWKGPRAPRGGGWFGRRR